MRSRSSRPRSTSPPPSRSTSTGPPAQISSEVRRPRSFPFTASLVGALLVGALGLRLWGINFGLPAEYRSDEDVTVGRAMGVLHGILNPHFADWPHLYFYVAAAWLAPFRLIGLVSDQASAYLGVRILDALLGGATVILVFEFGRRAYGMLAGLVAVMAVSVAFLNVRDSHFGTVDVPLTLACLAGLYLAYRTMSGRGIRPLLINGMALGIATSLKYNGAFLVVAMATAQALRARTEEVGLDRWLARLGVIALVGGVVLLGTSPFLLLDPAMTVHGLGYIFQHLGRATAGAIGWVVLGKAIWFGLGPVLALMTVVGIAWAVRRGRPVDWIVLSFVVAYFLLIGSGGSVFFRYADPLIPPLLLLGGRAVAELLLMIASGAVRQTAAVVAALLILVPALIQDVTYDHLIQQTDTRTLAFDWLAQHVSTGARVAMPYKTGPAHDQALIDSGEQSHAATDPYVASFLENRLETQYRILELTPDDLQLTSLDRFRQQGIHLIVIGYKTPGTGCQPESPLERLLLSQGHQVASFSPTAGCPSSVFDPIDTYYVPLAGYAGWLRPGPYLRIYEIS